MKIVLGLGNPGARYRLTRHNLGFRVADALAERHGASFRPDEEVQAWTAEIRRGGRVVLAKPRTLMNRSGRAALALARRHAALPSEILVVYDDADLAIGRLRIRAEGGTGGHNGIRSITAALGTGAFPRIRLGVRGAGREHEDLASYVLRDFDPQEQDTAASLVDAAALAVETILEEGLAAAMNRWNRDVPPA